MSARSNRLWGVLSPSITLLSLLQFGLHFRNDVLKVRVRSPQGCIELLPVPSLIANGLVGPLGPLEESGIVSRLLESRLELVDDRLRRPERRHRADDEV